jgi:AraC family transcriptional regulator of adaptative response/methylated-DNA-[protein]-cysteine methyltransferase
VDEQAMWEAVTVHDAAAEGRFVYAVSSTGVYCRPTCPSRRPRRDRVAFFATPQAAAAAGYRACRRCRPDDDGVSGIDRRTSAAAAYLAAHVDERVTLAELAAHVDASPSHLQRTFARAYGESPRRYQERLRVEALKARLRDGAGVSEAGYEAGFGSARGVYAGAAQHLAMTPARYRSGGSGLTIRYALVRSPIAALAVGMTDRGVCAVLLADDEEAALAELEAEFPNARLLEAEPSSAEVVRAVVAHVAGVSAGPVPLDLVGTAFQRRVWAELQKVARGETSTYGEIAERIGRPTATRAVASACAGNHVGVLVPCHRIVRSDGGLGGYKWGVERKRRLLDREADAG